MPPAYTLRKKKSEFRINIFFQLFPTKIVGKRLMGLIKSLLQRGLSKKIKNFLSNLFLVQILTQVPEF